MEAHLGSSLGSFPVTAPLLGLNELAAPSGQAWPGPLSPASRGKAKALRVLSWQDSLEFPHLAETGMKEEEEGGLAGDSLGGVVHADSRAGPTMG